MPSDACFSPDRLRAERHLRLLVGLIAGTLFMEILDGSVITTAMPMMAETFHCAPVAVNIGISIYLLVLGVLIPASSSIADRYGTRRVFLMAIAIFTAASALCGAASSLSFFVMARVLQGVGGAMIEVARFV